MNGFDLDVAVIGGGPGGLAAASAACRAGAGRVAVFERGESVGGVLRQCIHDGFGLFRYGEALTGPEYAARAAAEARAAGAVFFAGTAVTALRPDRSFTAVSPRGLSRVRAGAVVLATGCRERTRAAVGIPGDRPAGVFTAGTVQELLNLRRIAVGTSAVILGSGDVGLIAARRLTLCGAAVKEIAEIGPAPTGLARNVAQCALEFGIPLRVRTTAVRVVGRGRVEAVVLADVDETGTPVPGTERTVPCDTLVLSVGLIPENELLRAAGGAVAPGGAAETDPAQMTALSGVFACGNCRRVEQLADTVSLMGESAGENAARFAAGRPLIPAADALRPVYPTGFPEAGTVICTGCPRGCSVRALPGGRFSGNRCPRGAAFAAAEAAAPQRVLTATLLTADGRTVSVRSAGTVDAARVRPLAAALAAVRLPAGAYAPGDALAAPDGTPLTVTRG